MHNWSLRLRSWRRWSVDVTINCCRRVHTMLLERKRRWLRRRKRRRKRIRKTVLSTRPRIPQRACIQLLQALGVVPNLLQLRVVCLLQGILILRTTQPFILRNWRHALKCSWKRLRKTWRWTIFLHLRTFCCFWSQLP